MADRCIKARFHRIGEPNANIAVESDGTALGMIAVSVRIVSRQCDIGVAPGCRKASRGLPSDRRETPAIQPEFETWRGAACGCHGINRSTQRRAAHTERIGAAIYFDPLEHLRVKFLEVAIVVRKVDGNAILQQRNRSEEHTSELQSLMRISYAVFCLKKK